MEDLRINYCDLYSTCMTNARASLTYFSGKYRSKNARVIEILWEDGDHITFKHH
jgi:hypothetical protein